MAITYYDEKNRLNVYALQAATGTGDGEWVETGALRTASIHVEGITTATVTITGSNELTMPLNTAHGVEFSASPLTADGLIELQVPTKYMKVRVTAYTSGTINAYIYGVRTDV